MELVTVEKCPETPVELTQIHPDKQVKSIVWSYNLLRVVYQIGEVNKDNILLTKNVL